MKPYIVYILKCSDDTLYCGITNDFEKRMRAHNGEVPNGAKYTSMRRPVVCVYRQGFENRSSALKEEIRIKKLSRVQKLILINT